MREPFSSKRAFVAMGQAAMALALVALAICGAAMPAAARPATTVLSGVVVNGNDEPVAGARVYWQKADGSSPHFLRTDAEGRFQSKPLHAGLYEVRAQARGLWSEWQHNVLVRSGSGTEIKLRLARQTPPGRAVAQPK